METINLSTTEASVLGLVAFGERSGYDLARDAETSVAYMWTPSRSQIYKVLPRLVASGLAASRGVAQQGRPDKSLYAITPPGERALRAWLDEVEEEPVGGGIVFVLKLFFCDFASEGTALAQLEGYRRYLERRLGSYEALDRDSGEREYVYPWYTLRHGLARVRATLAWIDETEAAICSSKRPSLSRPRRR
jgi:PadR family transcriptional regulator, regulatory protein AphA